MSTWFTIVPKLAEAKPWPPHGPFRSKAIAHAKLQSYYESRLYDPTVRRGEGLIVGPFRRETDAREHWRKSVAAYLNPNDD